MVNWINLIAKDTTEYHVLEVTRDKTEVFRKVIDGGLSDPANEGGFWRVLSREFKTPSTTPYAEPLRATPMQIPRGEEDKERDDH